MLSTFFEGKWSPPVTGEYFPSDLMNLGDLDGDCFDDAGLVVLTESFFYYRSYIVSGSTRRIVNRIPGADQPVTGLDDLVRLADIDGDGTQELALQVQDASVRYDDVEGYGLCVVTFERTTR